MKSNWTLVRNVSKLKSIFRCACGTEKEVFTNNIVRGLSQSCGCLHKVSNKPERRAWSLMKYRCLTPSSPDFARYGGRGIGVCESWLVFDNFFADMGKKPFPGATIERLNVDIGYQPDNCVWVSMAQQAQNRTTTRWIEVEGKMVCLSEAARRCGLKNSTVRERIKRGWSEENALSTPVCATILI